MSTFVKKSRVPETVVGEEGSAKRNIQRKGKPGKSRKEGLSGQAVDDGSMDAAGVAMDEHDPNFDSEDDTDGRVAIPTYAALARDDIALSSITLPAYKQRAEPIIKEFFTSGDFDEVAKSLQDIGAPAYSYEFVKRLVNMSCDAGDRERELTSQLLSNLYPDIFSSSIIGKGFERLFEMIDEIEKDAPDARKILSTYLARAVVDEILPPSFLADSVVRNLGGDVVEHAKLMLSQEHAGAKLERSWGPGDGRPVEEMKVAVDQLLLEFLLSKDMTEAKRCIAELNSPLFFHEILKRAVINALDKSTAEQQQMSQLLHELRAAEMLSVQQAEKGFSRLFLMLPDLVLDTPSARSIISEFLQRARDSSVVSAAYQPPADAVTAAAV